MRLLTKAEACRELGVSLSTLNRRIAAGEVAVKREPHGRRHRAYVMLDDEPPGNGDEVDSGGRALAVAQERIRHLETQVELLREQLDHERRRNASLADELPTAQDRHGPWWRFWRWRDDSHALTGRAGRGMMDSKTNRYGQ